MVNNIKSFMNINVLLTFILTTFGSITFLGYKLFLFNETRNLELLALSLMNKNLENKLELALVQLSNVRVVNLQPIETSFTKTLLLKLEMFFSNVICSETSLIICIGCFGFILCSSFIVKVLGHTPLGQFVSSVFTVGTSTISIITNLPNNVISYFNPPIVTVDTKLDNLAIALNRLNASLESNIQSNFVDGLTNLSSSNSGNTELFSTLHEKLVEASIHDAGVKVVLDAFQSNSINLSTTDLLYLNSNIVEPILKNIRLSADEIVNRLTAYGFGTKMPTSPDSPIISDVLSVGFRGLTSNSSLSTGIDDLALQIATNPSVCLLSELVGHSGDY